MAFCRCVWMLLACACSCACAATLAGSDCGEECALCLLGQRDAFSTLTCSIECDGEPDGEKLRLCWDALTEEPDRVPFDGQDGDATGGGDADSPERQPVKKYGGFMKRYGGFMSRRSPSSDDPAATATAGAEREEKIRLEILKILNTASQSGEPAEGPAAKRYGGFLRRADDEGELRGRLLEAVLDRGLRKRYGGFMRRVGRPEWLLDGGGGAGKSGGVSKRAREDGQQQKRYGGFMD